MDISGTVVPMATPIDRGSQDVDEDALVEFTQSLADAGVHGLFPGSSIGEFPSVTAEQHRRIVRTVVSAAGDTPVLAGCCGTSVADVRARIRTAADVGADAGVVVTPYYLSTTQEGLQRFFEAVADEAALPLLLYNIPPLAGNELAVETVCELARHDAFVGLKDTSGDLTYQYRVVTETPPDFAVFQGATEGAGTALALGADGLIAGPANVFPEAMVELYEAHERGDAATVDRLVREVVMPIVSETSDVPTAAAIKYLVGLRELDIGEPLPPIPPLSGADRDRLAACCRAVTDALEAMPAGQ